MNLIMRGDWREDLEETTELCERQKVYIGFIVNWFESWREAKELELTREVARKFWKDSVCNKMRASWQKNQWAEGMRWYLNWVKRCEKIGVQPKLGTRRTQPEVSLSMSLLSS